jgi:hypothetical protein
LKGSNSILFFLDAWDEPFIRVAFRDQTKPAVYKRRMSDAIWKRVL